MPLLLNQRYGIYKMIDVNLCFTYIVSGQGQPCQTQGHEEWSEGRDLSGKVQESAGQESDALEKVVAETT